MIEDDESCSGYIKLGTYSQNVYFESKFLSIGLEI